MGHDLPKITVEQCKSISTKFLNDNGVLEEGFHHGEISWGFGRNTDTIGFMTSIHKEETRISFEYTETDSLTKKITPVSYKIFLTSTPCHFGNKRWWFICPLGIDGQRCNRRVGILYLRETYFGCRHCYDLTYASCQKNYYLDSLTKAMSQDNFKSLFKDNWQNPGKIL